MNTEEIVDVALENICEIARIHPSYRGEIRRHILSAVKRATEKKDETLRTIQVQMPRFSYALQRPSGEFKGYDVWLHDYIAEALK